MERDLGNIEGGSPDVLPGARNGGRDACRVLERRKAGEISISVWWNLPRRRRRGGRSRPTWMCGVLSSAGGGLAGSSFARLPRAPAAALDGHGIPCDAEPLRSRRSSVFPTREIPVSHPWNAVNHKRKSDGILRLDPDQPEEKRPAISVWFDCTELRRSPDMNRPAPAEIRSGPSSHTDPPQINSPHPRRGRTCARC